MSAAEEADALAPRLYANTAERPAGLERPAGIDLKSGGRGRFPRVACTAPEVVRGPEPGL